MLLYAYLIIIIANIQPQLSNAHKTEQNYYTVDTRGPCHLSGFATETTLPEWSNKIVLQLVGPLPKTITYFHPISRTLLLLIKLPYRTCELYVQDMRLTQQLLISKYSFKQKLKIPRMLIIPRIYLCNQ